MVGWAIVGIGAHADLRIAPGIGIARDTGFAAVWSRDKARAEAFARKHGAARSYDSYADLLASPDVDVVYIATPNSLHREQTVQAARAGKHVLCEKPMALTSVDAGDMIEACEKAGVRLGLAFQNRQHPAHQAVRRLVATGEAGQIALATAQYNHNFPPGFHWPGWRASRSMAGGGTLMGMGLHALDLLRFVLGREVDEVMAFSDEDVAAGRVDENVACLLRFAGGPQAFVSCGLHVAHTRNDLVLHGSSLRIEAIGTIGMPWQGTLQVTKDAGTSATALPDQIGTSWQSTLLVTKGTETTTTSFPCRNPVIDLYVKLVEDFNRSVVEGAEPLATGHDGLAMVSVAEAIVASGRERRAVRVSSAKNEAWHG